MKYAVVLVGASAVGKTTLAVRLLSCDGEFAYIRSATTRAARGDAHDSEYIYLSRDEFLSRAEKGEMLEYMEYGGNCYGTPKSELERAFSEGKTPLLILDLEGISALRSKELDRHSFLPHMRLEALPHPLQRFVTNKRLEAPADRPHP